jgi:ABC-type nitrate/sulfonate/bicarbonate transport system substrate-binding protein
LREYISNTAERLTLGVVYQHSSHGVVLRNWLRSHAIDPDRDVQLVVVPPAQVHANFKAGHIQGYCVGDPWNSLAVLSRTGWIAATSAELEPGHPEKVLLVRRDFAERHEGEHLALIAALVEAGRFCDAPENHERLVEVLAQPDAVNAPVQAVRMSLSGTFDFGQGRVEKTGRQLVFHRDGANEPDPSKAEWVINNLIQSGAIGDGGLIPPTAAEHCFRSDLFHQAVKLINSRP